jgi:hypothetical protein
MADILSAISVLLVFLTFLLNGLQKDVDELLEARKPPEAQEEKLKQVNNTLLKLLWLKAIPVCLVFAVIFYLLLPKAIDIVSKDQLSLWNFDTLSTLFVFIEIGVFGLAVFGIFKACQLVGKYNSKD